jgi:predicted DNA-binding WGR domain protein
MRADGTVVIRFGRRGSIGQTRTKIFSTYGAEEFVYEQLKSKEHKDYVATYQDRVSGNNPEPAVLPRTTEGIEQVCLDRWREVATQGVVGTPEHWALVYNLLELSKFDMYYRFILEELQAGPHVISTSQDFVVGAVHDPWSINRPRTIEGNYIKRVVDMGAIEQADSSETLAVALSLYNPEVEDSESFMKVARRLGEVVTR